MLPLLSPNSECREVTNTEEEFCLYKGHANPNSKKLNLYVSNWPRGREWVIVDVDKDVGNAKLDSSP
jgi:hypothetical protein